MIIRRLLLGALLSTTCLQADVVSYADRGLAQSYEGLTFTPGTYSGAKVTKDEVEHTTTWTTGTEPPASLAMLAAGLVTTDDSLLVYTLTDSVDGSRLLPAFDELLSTPLAKGAAIQCYPWSYPFVNGSIRAGWEIDSWLWRHTEVLPVFARGTTPGPAHSVLVSADPAQTALDALRLRKRLIAVNGIARPSNPLVRTAYALEQELGQLPETTHFLDYVPYSVDGTTTYAITTTRPAPLSIALSWIDSSGWDFEGNTQNLAIDLDLEVTFLQEDCPVRILGGEGSVRDSSNTLETVFLPLADPGTYLVTVRGTSLIEDSTQGGAAALAIAGDCDTVTANPSVKALTFRREGTNSVASCPVPGTYLLPTNTPAPVYAYSLSATGIPYARHRLSVMPAQGDSLVLSWGDETEAYRIRTYLFPDGDVEQAEIVSDTWYPPNTTLTFRLPEDYPRGERYEKDGRTYRAGGLGFGFPGDIEWPFSLPTGPFLVDSGYDITFSYFDEDDFFYSETIPDYWFSRYLMDFYDYGENDYLDEADPDGDGFTNYEEYVTNTDPTDPEDRLTITSVSPDGLTYRGGKDRTVRLEKTRTLSDPASWRTTGFEVPLEAGAFYRLSVSE